MIDLTVPEKGALPRELLLEVIADTFDAAHDLSAPAATVPQLQPSIDLARAAQARNDAAALDGFLRDIAVAAIATRVRMKAALDPRTS